MPKKSTPVDNFVEKSVPGRLKGPFFGLSIGL